MFHLPRARRRHLHRLDGERPRARVRPAGAGGLEHGGVETRPASLVAGDLVLGGVRLDGEGFLAIPDAPGLGVRWNWPHIERLGRG